VFILASAGKPNKSWIGEIAIAATELQIARIIPRWISLGAHPRYCKANLFSASISA
jgi:hypothetical protein